MTRLPRTVQFDAAAFPELADIFRNIDLAIAAIVASDPSMRPKPAQKRPARRIKAAQTSRRVRPAHRKAA